jgi:hypothetical protein
MKLCKSGFKRRKCSFSWQSEQIEESDFNAIIFFFAYIVQNSIPFWKSAMSLEINALSALQVPNTKISVHFLE